MASILDSLPEIIYGATRSIFLDGTLIRTTISAPTDPYDPSTGTTAQVSYACKAIHEEYSLGYYQNNLVRQSDRKLLILAASISVEPRPGDRVTIRGETFTIVPANTAGTKAVQTDPAKAVWICRAAR